MFVASGVYNGKKPYTDIGMNTNKDIGICAAYIIDTDFPEIQRWNSNKRRKVQLTVMLYLYTLSENEEK